VAGGTTRPRWGRPRWACAWRATPANSRIKHALLRLVQCLLRAFTWPCPVFLGHPLHPVVILYDPSVRWHVVWYFHDGQLGKSPGSGLNAHIFHYLHECRVVSAHISDEEPVWWSLDVSCGLLVHVFGGLRQAEPPIAPVDHDFRGHLVFLRGAVVASVGVGTTFFPLEIIIY